MTLLLHLLSSVALLLWGLRLVRTGVMRAFGSDLRRLARNADGKVLPAMMTGLLAAAVLQSSTATAMIVATFSAQNIVSTATAFIAVLGADVGTALAVLVASQKILFIAPVFIILGVFGFLSTEISKYRSIARAFLGLGLILLALSMISSTATQLAGNPDLRTIIDIFVKQPFLMVLLGAGLTYLAHSSLAIVLLCSGFVVSGLLTVHSALFMVLGANVGSGLLPVLAFWNANSGGRIPVTANLLVRLLGVVIAFPLTAPILEQLEPYASVHLQPAIFHLLLNVFIAVVGLILLRVFLSVAKSIVPDDVPDPAYVVPKYLDEAVFSAPAKALACAKREALVMADIAQNMVLKSLPALLNGNEQSRSEISAMDDSVDRLFDAIKIYVARIVQEELSEEDSHKAFAVFSFITNMEHVGDIVDGGVMELAAKKSDLKIHFSDEGVVEICNLHEAVCRNFDLAINTFVSDDGELARQLHSAKAKVRKIERKSIATHIERIGAGQPESIGTSGLHLDVVRDLKRINSHLTAIAYPVLRASGEVPKTKWKRLDI